MNLSRVFASFVVVASQLAAMAQHPPSPAASTGRTGAPPLAMSAWFVRLIPPRPTFDKDMTAAEQKLTEEQYVYWSGESDAGVCVFGGPILDPKGFYNLVVIRAANEEDARAIASHDPSVRAGLNHIEVLQMKVDFPPKKN